MWQDDDIPVEWSETFVQDKPPREEPEFIEEPIFEVSFRDFERTAFGTANMHNIISGAGGYNQKMDSLNKLNDPMDRAYGRATLAASHFFGIHDEIDLLRVVSQFQKIEYLNMVALIGAILFYRSHNLGDNNKFLRQEDLSKFYKKHNLKSEITIEDLLRYTRLTIKTLSKK